ncbi:MAG: excinuclease ABC subunit UvrA, partial [Desulfosudaceae bacterium]
MISDEINIYGARQHNLKNIDVSLPRNKLVVITGLSGSGKSSLAFDTLYAEGQRRYVESLSTYARQFLGRMDKPDVDRIDGLSPAIAIEQKTASHNPRSTVGTVTEIYDYLRLLFARCGRPHCYQCGQPIASQTIDQMTDRVMSLAEGTALIILAPLVTNQKGAHEKLFNGLKKEGFARVKIDGRIVDIESVKKPDKRKKHTIAVVCDRLRIKPGLEKRLADSLELALAKSGGLVMVDVLDATLKKTTETILFSETAACDRCGISCPELTPASFSFNSPQGACDKCDGLGTVMELDPDLLVPDRNRSLREGAVAVWANRNSVQFAEFLDALTRFYGLDIYTPFKDLPEKFQQVLLYGSDTVEIPFYFERGGRRVTYQKPFEGVIPNLHRRYLETGSSWSRDEIRQYMNFRPCDACGGTRLNPASSAVRIDRQTISQLTALSVSKARAFFSELSFSGKKSIIAAPILKELCDRLGFLEDVGLNYLTLDRSASTLSGGESQRIRLATQIGSRLTGVLYVLDEPSIGLHQRDNRRLLSSLLKMRDLGNTVLVVEHDRETIMAADHVIDMGPGAGLKGGAVVFSGPPRALLKDPESLTGQYFSGRKQIDVPGQRRQSDRTLELRRAAQNNLKEINVSFPLGTLICVTGVSGSGKSTLVLDTLYRCLAQALYHSRKPAGRHGELRGSRQVDKVINIDQSPIGRTPRSNPGTYTGVFTFIRELFARTPEARARGYKPGR